MVQSVQRALSLLELLDAGGPGGCGLAELCTSTGLKAPTVHNLLATLVHLGYARQDPASRRYALGERATSLGTGRADAMRLKQAATDPVRALQAELNETVILAADIDAERHSLLSCESRHELSVKAATGVDASFYNTATGRVLLALRSPSCLAAFVEAHGLPGEAWPGVSDRAGLSQALAAIRSAGHADYTKLDTHVRALAVPICLARNRLRAALGLFYPTVRDVPGRAVELVRRLRETAAEIAGLYERM